MAGRNSNSIDIDIGMDIDIDIDINSNIIISTCITWLVKMQKGMSSFIGMHRSCGKQTKHLLNALFCTANNIQYGSGSGSVSVTCIVMW